ncbi:Acyl-CoA synthetase (AMP-forming)/AMP-acid ligase II [Rhizobiales bacterium GAS191]|nr:Acyl-CoA synthetase (AMP-forming)/AMP-acid ligase II [Rhizobiales bacterium GAS113]SED81398.1 Acyl-CoA synthetase (AMP-forming)/AMP-acid ligase II [Rhizobiales bacterium GAS191]SEE63807.1 Acyl-CoA synthetase (AMP-forming)/AMP-acid ligase II [Rhizobiales bacterium GAS188]
MQRNSSSSLLEALRGTGDLSGRMLLGADAGVALGEIIAGTTLGLPLADLAGRSVLIATREQLASALALIELDGVAGRITLCPADLPPEYLAPIAADAAAEAIITDRDAAAFPGLSLPIVASSLPIVPRAAAVARERATEWVLLTSGTTGVPKLVMHSLDGLTGAIKSPPKSLTKRETPIVWATFYDIRRYGGLQIFLRAVTGTGSLVLSSAAETVADYLHRLARAKVTHISGTPSHWRRALMSPDAGAIAPDYVRLSGEIADQAILDNLRRVYPHAAIGHAYASTEAGVGFEVTDGLEGFPANLMQRDGDVRMKVEDGSLRIRSSRTASLYVGQRGGAVADADGFVDTGDMLELRGDRYYFVGRRGGIINVGGLKVHPEEVEAIINRHASVRMSLVKARRNPITGAIIVAEVVLTDEALAAQAGADDREIKKGILQACRDKLAPYKVPASIRIVASLDVTTAGKLARSNA